MSARWLLVLPFLFACSSNEPLSVLTYNAGLAVGFVPGANERSVITAEATVAVDADVVCLQEVWLPEHVADFEAAAAGTYEHTYFPAAQQEELSTPACAADDVEPLITCLDINCSDVCADELPDCVVSSCVVPFAGLEDSCMECVQANIGGEPEEVEATCTAVHTKYAYGGSFGTGLLSRYELKSVEEHVFSSTTNRRGLLHAVVDAPLGDVDVYCTHLTAELSVIPYPKAEGSWEEEQEVQIGEMRATINDTSETGRKVLLGDMNNGPEMEGVEGELVGNWNQLYPGSWQTPYIDLVGECTFCPENALSSVDSDETGRLIDHVFIGGFEGDITAERVLDEEITVQSCGQDIPGAYSDHYGVMVTATKK